MTSNANPLSCGCPIVIREDTFEKARKRIQEEKAKNPNVKIIFPCQDDELSRKILEKEPIDVLVLLQANRKDFLKQRNSGLNQVLADIAKKKAIKIGICLDEIIASSSNPELKSKILSRVIQNIQICKKAKVLMKFCGKSTAERNIYDLKSLGLVLGMPTWMTSKLNSF